MQGGKDSNNQSYYGANVGVLQEVQNWFNSNSGQCSIDASGYYSSCFGAGFGRVNAASGGDVDANASGVNCNVYGVDGSYCIR